MTLGRFKFFNKALRVLLFLGVVSGLFFNLDSKAQTLPSNQASEPWTYFFYISGDNHYKGQTMRQDGRIRHEDQARRLSREVKKIAYSDQSNNYAIFYDPKGSPLLYYN